MINWETLTTTTAKLSPFWTPQKGLTYPTHLIINGEKVTIKNYEEHHTIIQKLFKNK